MKYVLLSLKSITKKDKTGMKYYITDNIILFFQKTFYITMFLFQDPEIYIQKSFCNKCVSRIYKVCLFTLKSQGVLSASFSDNSLFRATPCHARGFSSISLLPFSAVFFCMSSSIYKMSRHPGWSFIFPNSASLTPAQTCTTELCTVNCI